MKELQQINQVIEKKTQCKRRCINSFITNTIFIYKNNLSEIDFV